MKNDKKTSNNYEKQLRSARNGKMKATTVPGSNSDELAPPSSIGGTGGQQSSGLKRNHAASLELGLEGEESAQGQEPKRAKTDDWFEQYMASEINDLGLNTTDTFDALIPSRASGPGEPLSSTSLHPALATTTNIISHTSAPRKCVFSAVPAVTFNPWED
ncbi:hypothetical protein CC1G_12271 [Coprinopsis cinerea okayama7|uniref:Uncharacterized protein n=1 Tax=Coprinopsis cinerea (strain Okayama-7 / 130 / ATCC MYA-4618 / FGSC 9003) TaxID=240176 RepID=A8NSX3_COPC7|nr:hypothetical protein CC1G_12271 [Coprinopsis cinerea okayama7\|eukprot:XP_001836112.2 hypothetical protein CC1G_12271 [Coprinopsis cinerea okayama7\